MDTFGPAVLLDGPLPVAPRFNIFTVAQELPDSIDGVAERWGNGVNVFPYPADLPLGFDPCSTGTFRQKEEGEAVPLPTFGAFTAYLPIRCTAGGIADDAEFKSRAVAALAATEAFAAERQLALGDPMNENPFLTDGNADVLGGAAVTPLLALALLEDAIGATGRGGVLHATPSIAILWGDRLVKDGATLRTTVGTPVVVGGGYIGAADEGDTLGTDEQYAFATGPLLYAKSDMTINPPTMREAVDRSTNDVVYRAERDLLILWDTVLQAAALIDLS